MSRTAWLTLVAVAFLLAACQPLSPTVSVPVIGACSESIAIYLTAQPMNGGAGLKADTARLALQDQPIIAAHDIVSYDRQQGGLVLSDAALQRLAALNVPLDGRTFVVCSGGRRLAVGAFWTPLSSASYDGMVIMAPFGPDEKTAIWASAYPGGSANALNNPAILDALSKAGKLH